MDKLPPQPPNNGGSFTPARRNDEPWYVRRVRRVSPELQIVAIQNRHQMTPAESVLWEAIRNKRFNGLRFRAQHAIGTFILDFYCPLYKLVVEVDGGVHDDPDVKEHDKLREEYLQAGGYHILRLRNEIILENLDEALQQILTTIAHITATASPKTPPIIGGLGGQETYD
jgi:very-short-patch-repair endonuclease